MLDLLGRLADAQGLAIAFTTHQPNHALAIADKVLLMLDGTRTVCGATSAVMTEANLEALYGLPVCTARFGPDGRGRAFVPGFRQRGAQAPS